MPTFYLDPVNGNDANDGSTWALAWKTLTNGATAVRIAPGDTIKLPKSPDPVSIGSCAWTKDSATITIPEGTILDIERCETAWTASANITCSANSTYKTEGSYALRVVPATAFTTGLAAYKDVSTLNLSSYSKIAFFVKGSSSIAANTWRLDLCTNNDGTGAVHSFTIDRVIPTEGAFLVFDNGSAMNSAIESVSLTALSDPGTASLYIDNIIAGNDLLLGQVIAQSSSGPWFPIISISGTDVTLGRYSTSLTTTPCPLASATVTTYTRECIYGWGSSNVVNDSGTAGNLISFKGGYNTSTGDCDGQTWINSFGNELFDCSKNYIHVENIHIFNASMFETIGAGYLSLKDVSLAGGNAILNGGNYAFNYVTAQGTIITTSSPYGLSNCPASSHDWDIDAAIDLYGYTSSDTTFYIQGRQHKFKGKIRTYCNDTNFATNINIEDGSAVYLREVELYDGHYALNMGGSIARIDKLTLNGNILYLSTASSSYLTSLDIGYLAADNTPTFSMLATTYGHHAVERWLADDRYCAVFYYGKVSDHITGGQTADWAYGETGLSLLLDPSRTYIPLLHEIYLPVKSGTTYQLHFQVRKTSAGADCTMTLDLHNCGITPIDDESVTLTDSWAEHTSSSFTPTRNGFVRAIFKALDGSTTGDIGIDDIHLATV